ncbi:hypothetical protein [Rodentibacter caecimuris]
MRNLTYAFRGVGNTGIDIVVLGYSVPILALPQQLPHFSKTRSTL